MGPFELPGIKDLFQQDGPLTLGPVEGNKRLCILTHILVCLSHPGGRFPPSAGASAHVLQSVTSAFAGLVGAQTAGVPRVRSSSPRRPGSAEVMLLQDGESS